MCLKGEFCMGLQFKDFTSIEFENAFKKVCAFEHPMEDRIKLARLMKKISKEKEVYVDIMRHIEELYQKEFLVAETEEAKRKINFEFFKEKTKLEKSSSDIDLEIDFEIVSKTNVDTNELYLLLPILVNMPE
jgi:hypothetical protein